MTGIGIDPADPPETAPGSPDVEAPSDAAPPSAPAPPARPWYRRRIAALAALAVALLGYPAAKIAIGLLAVNLASGVATAAFGSQWDRMPSGVRDGLENRLEAVYGSSLDGVTDAAKSARVEADVLNGLARLDDASLVSRLEIFSRTLGVMSVADCAALGRTSLAGERPSAEMAERLQESFSSADYQAWVAIAVSAIEAQHRGVPAVRVVPAADRDAALERVLGSMTDEQLRLLSRVWSDPSAADADLCSAFRSLYEASASADAQTRAVMARYDVTAAP